MLAARRQQLTQRQTRLRRLFDIVYVAVGLPAAIGLAWWLAVIWPC